MRFCIECDNIVVPKKNYPNILYCKVCDKSYNIGQENERDNKDFKISYKPVKSTKSKDIFVKKSTRSITDEDRRAFEDYILDDET